MGQKRKSRHDSEIFAPDYKVLKKYHYVSQHFTDDRYKRFQYLHIDSTYHFSKASLLEYYGIRLKLPCECPVAIEKTDPPTTIKGPVLWDPQSLSKCDYNTTPTDDNVYFIRPSLIDRYLAPCVPGRLMYLEFLKTLLEPYNVSISVLDIGTGASAIYALLGARVFNWTFVATDICHAALEIAKYNIDLNNLESMIVLRRQENPYNIFTGVLNSAEFFYFSISNPPFYSIVNDRKDNPKTHKMGTENETMFSIPQDMEIVISQKYIDVTNSISHFSFNDYLRKNSYIEGELGFVRLMIFESRFYIPNVVWFTSIVSKKNNLNKLKKLIDNEMAEFAANDLAIQKMQTAYTDLCCRRVLNKVNNVDFNDFDYHFHAFKIRERRIFEIKPGTTSRSILCWTYYSQQQRESLLIGLSNINNFV